MADTNYKLEDYTGADIQDLLNFVHNHKDHITYGRSIFDNNRDGNTAIEGTTGAYSVYLNYVTLAGSYLFPSGTTLHDGPTTVDWGPTGIIVDEITSWDGVTSGNVPVLRQTIFKAGTSTADIYTRFRKKSGQNPWTAWSKILTNTDIDATLTEEGKPADAKAAGKRIDDLWHDVGETTENVFKFTEVIDRSLRNDTLFTHYPNNSTIEISCTQALDSEYAVICRDTFLTAGVTYKTKITASQSPTLNYSIRRMNRETGVTIEEISNKAEFTPIVDSYVRISFAAGSTPNGTLEIYIAEADKFQEDSIPNKTAKDDRARQDVEKEVINRKYADIATRDMFKYDLVELPWRKAGEYGVNYTTGNLVTSNAFAYTDYVLVRGFSTLTYMRLCSTSGVSCGLAYYDKDYNFISGITGLGNRSSNNPVESTTKVPANAIYARFTYRKDTNTYGDFSVSGWSNNERLVPFAGNDRTLEQGATDAQSIAISKIGYSFFFNGVCPESEQHPSWAWFGLLSKPEPTRSYSAVPSGSFSRKLRLQGGHIYEISLYLLSGTAIGDGISLRIFDDVSPIPNQYINNGCCIGETKTFFISETTYTCLCLRINQNCGFENGEIFVKLKDITDSDRIFPLMFSDATILEHKVYGLFGGLSNNDNYNTFKFYPVDSSYRYYVNQRCFISEFRNNANDYSGEIKRDMYTPGSVVKMDSSTKYVIISVYADTMDTFCFHKIDTIEDKMLGVLADKSDQALASFGVMNSIAAARQFATIEYTTKARMPYLETGFKKMGKPAGTKLKGIPYTSTGVLSKCVGQHVTFYTFLSAIENPKSVLYTRRITFRKAGTTYYGGTCFTLTSYAFGSRLGYHDNTYAHIEVDKDYTEYSPYDLQDGDLLYSGSHVIMAGRVYRDEYGRIINYVMMQHMAPFPRISTQAFDVLEDGYLRAGGTHEDPQYKMRVFRPNTRIDRRTGMYDYGSYEPLPCVKGYADEVITPYTFPDIMPEYGDKACISTVEAENGVNINVLNSEGYTSIKVYKDEELIDTLAVEDFNTGALSYGTYEFKLVGSNKSSSSYLIVVDFDGTTYDSENARVKVKSRNAEAVYAAAYADYQSREDKQGVPHNIKRFTKTEATYNKNTKQTPLSGWIDVSDIVDSSFSNILVGFLTEFGVAVWLSNPNFYDPTKYSNSWEPFDDDTPDVDPSSDDDEPD